MEDICALSLADSYQDPAPLSFGKTGKGASHRELLLNRLLIRVGSVSWFTIPLNPNSTKPTELTRCQAGMVAIGSAAFPPAPLKGECRERPFGSESFEGKVSGAGSGTFQSLDPAPFDATVSL